MQRAGVPLALCAVVGLQMVLLHYFGGWRLLEDRPLAGLDFDTHIEQAWRVIEGLDGWGKSWVYDVQLLSGYPNGTIFDADNKGWEIWTWIGTKLGLSQARAFNSFVLGAHLLFIPVIYGVARLFRVGPWGSVLATFFAVLYWNFDSWTHWCWYVGMVAYAFAGYVALLPLGLFYRWLEDRRPWQAVALAVTLAVCHLLHPYTFLILVVPMALLYGRAFKTLGRSGHAWVAFAVVATLGLNAYWLSAAAQFWHYILDSAFFANTGIMNLPADIFEIVIDPSSTGVIAMKTAFRMGFIAASIVLLVIWRRERDPRFLLFVVALSTLAVFAYVGGHTPLRQVQPYRHVLPLGFLALIGAAALLERMVHERWWSAFDARARMIIGLLSVPATLYPLSDAFYYFAHPNPDPHALPLADRTSLSAIGAGQTPYYGYLDWHDDELAKFVNEHDDGTSRWLVEGWHVGEQLTWKTDAQIIGGFIWRNLEHSWSNLFRRRPQGIAKPDELRTYFKRYAVGWVIVSTPAERAPWWDKLKVLEKVAEVGDVRIYRTTIEPNLVAEGGGRVVASTNRLEVTGTDPNVPVVLRYHWMETLVCEPDCEVARRKVRDDKVGFISVPAPHPADFVISNGY